MCDRKTSLTDPTADFVLSDLLTATEDLIDFAINLFDTIRLQTHFNDRNRRISLATQLQDVNDAQKIEFGFVDIPIKPCTVTTTLKYDLTLYLDRILQACKRTKANLTSLRVSRTRSNNTTLLLVASTIVRVEKLNKKVQLLTRLVKENENEKIESKKPSLNLMSKEDLNDYVEITLSFRMIISKYREFIQHIRNATRSILSSNSQASIANSIVLIPIAANAINELNNILNRLIRIAFTLEAESNYLRQPPIVSDNKDISTNETTSFTERIGTTKMEEISGQNESNLKRSTYSLLKQNEIQSNNIRNQSAITSTISNMNSFKLTSNMIANIFQDFFYEYE